MLRPILHNPTVAGVGSWLGIITSAVTAIGWLVKMTPEWFGELTWPQSILIGLGGVIAGGLLLALATLIGGIGYRYFRPIAKERDESENKTTSPPLYDDRKLWSAVERIELKMGTIPTPPVSDVIEKLAKQVSQFQIELAPILKEREEVRRRANIEQRQEFARDLVDFLQSLIKPDPDRPGSFLGDNNAPLRDSVNHGLLQRVHFLNYGDEFREVRAKAASEVRSDAINCTVQPGEPWTDGKDKQRYYEYLRGIEAQIAFVTQKEGL